MAGPLGTLIVVVLKARNLPNKQRIGKQDPYATCTYLSHRKRTKTDKRGGQHPVWDDELRFDIYDNPKDAMASASVSTTATGGVVPVKSNVPPIGSAGSAGVKELRVAVYADDPRDPNLIGEGNVDLTDTLKKGEFDDWVTVTNKGKYQGEVYLEMTFYSAKPPPEKLHTPAGPTRAGVFEASSPGSGLRPTQPPNQAVASSSPLNRKNTPSPLGTPVKKINPASVPVALRVGRPMSGPISSGHLPLPGEPSTSRDASLNSRQRSTGSLSMPTPDFGLADRSPSRSPSRNQSLDRADHLVNSLNSLSLSGQTSANNHIHLPQPTPSELQVNQHPSQPRQHRHSFSGHSHLQPSDRTHQTHSASSSVHATDHPEDRFQDHPAPSFVPQPYPDHFPSSSQPSGIPRPVFPARRPLPVPGGDSVHRPTSAWGHSHSVPSEGQSYPNDSIVSSQQLPGNYAQYSDNFEHPPNGIPNVGTAYPPSTQYAEGANLQHGVHQQNMANRPQHLPYSEQPSHYSPSPSQNPPFSQTHHSGHAPYNLPPPPPGQTPVPIHEVFGGGANGRTFPPIPPNGYQPPAGFSTQQPQAVQVIQSPTRANSSGENVYSYPPTHHQEQVHQHNQSYNPPLENPAPNNNSYQLQNAPPPPPPHLQPMQYQPFHLQQAPASMPPPGPPSQMYYQPAYAPPPPTTPAPGFASSHPQQYPEYNNPFHNPPRPSSVVPGNVYVRPSPTPAPPPLPPPPHGQPPAHPHPHPASQSFAPFYPPNGYQPYPSHQS
ncbi:hypothetical protein PGT21_002232 [Puccinia graminis f. sp. tritici]|uniref:C2 domain-containing protein n=1 Tax=Puccinia graminis f. sp. tritici TaxID=56615 RepID=A0A5B0MI12_PUCGR|nr:hypothetical protein PGT21_002232 [Puccinia graminis f. sp. tritici]